MIPSAESVNPRFDLPIREKLRCPSRAQRSSPPGGPSAPIGAPPLFSSVSTNQSSSSCSRFPSPPLTRLPSTFTPTSARGGPITRRSGERYFAPRIPRIAQRLRESTFRAFNS